ncbi:MAG: 50S ribosomal protein L24 [Tatlockia sp.]|nr:50S ribosomal protein L24 [Tatlockia sp.]
MKRIKSGDTVIVIAGKSKGHVGKVLKVLNDLKKVIVSGANTIKKHEKPNPQIQKEGGIITREAPLDISNIAICNPVSNKADKVGFKFIEKDGKKNKVRYYKSNNEVIDLV